jgi:hypothetical protein
MRRGKVIVMLSAGVLALGTAAVAHGTAVPISYALQTRSVSAGAIAIGAPRGGTSSVPITSQQSNSQQASGLGNFSGSASAAALGPGGAEGSAVAVQDSTLGSTGFADSGFVQSSSILGSGEVAGAISSSIFRVTFNVSEAEGYTFSANLSGDGSALGRISLTSATGGNVFAPITAVNLSNFKSQGVLTPGTYSIIVDATTASAGLDAGMLNFSAALADGAVAAPAVEPVSQAVPLPAAWLDSSVMLGALAIFGTARRRLAAAR